MMIGLVVVLVVLLGLVGGATSGQCQEISIPMCKEIGYNFTRLPNQFNHETQEEAGLEVHQFWPLVKIECSPDLRFFLCSMYTPICIDTYQHALPACRSVCERARLGCLPVMQKHGFDWPKRMSCSKLPEYGGSELCMDAQAQDPRRGGPSISSGSRGEEVVGVLGQGSSPSFPSLGGYVGNNRPQCQCQTCGGSDRSGYINRLVRLRPGDLLYNHSGGGAVGWAEQQNCAAPCTSVFFTREDREFTELWLAVWAILCCLSTSLTFTTFLMDTARFHYPERPIMFLSLCYLMVSVGYLVRITVGHEAVSCVLQRPDEPETQYNQLVSRTGIPAADSSEASLLCTTVFVLVYFFSMASSVWWVILTFTWFLSAGLKWAQESISRNSQWYHCFAWSLPMIQTLAILLSSAVEGDSVGGVCYVGTRSPINLIIYVLIPLLVYLLLGISFLVAGFISLFRIRTVIKEQGGRAKIDKLEKLMVKIGIFSVLYIVPAGTVIACAAYELVSLPHWERSYLCPDCVPRNQLSYPDFSVLMLKYFMSLAVGITSGFWVWSGKTIDAWWSCLARMCGISRHLKAAPHVPVGGGGGAAGGGVGRAADPLPALPPGGVGCGNSQARSVTPATQTGNFYSTIPHKQTVPLNHV